MRCAKSASGCMGTVQYALQFKEIVICIVKSCVSALHAVALHAVEMSQCCTDKKDDILASWRHALPEFGGKYGKVATAFLPRNDRATSLSRVYKVTFEGISNQSDKAWFAMRLSGGSFQTWQASICGIVDKFVTDFLQMLIIGQLGELGTNGQHLNLCTECIHDLWTLYLCNAQAESMHAKANRVFV